MESKPWVPPGAPDEKCHKLHLTRIKPIDYKRAIDILTDKDEVKAHVPLLTLVCAPSLVILVSIYLRF